MGKEGGHWRCESGGCPPDLRPGRWRHRALLERARAACNGLALADQIRIEEKEARWRCAPIIGLSKPFRVAELLALVTRYGKRVIHSGFE
jgi:hypothetical protein